MPVVTRVAVASDAAVIARLNREVQRLHARLEPTFFNDNADDEVIEAFFSTKISRSEGHFVLASIANDEVGYVWFDVQVRPATPSTFPRTRIYVHHLSVREGSRRQGVASVLLRHVEEHALALDVKDIALDAWTANSSALSFFAARGFTPFNVSLRRKLP